MPDRGFDLLLVRHGITDWNEAGRALGRTEIPLNARGRAHAAALAAALHHVPFGVILSSPQRRARETAEAIAAARGLAVCTESALQEVWLGSWQGQNWRELQQDPDVHRFLEDATYVCAAVEPAMQVQERMVALVERLRSEGAGANVVLVSHGDPLRVLVAHYLSMPLAAYRSLLIDTGSLSILRFDPTLGARLKLLNWRPQRHRQQPTAEENV